MKDPRLANIPPNSALSTEVILNQLNAEDEPFAEYLWMEHEEEFNRQVRRLQARAHTHTQGQDRYAPHTHTHCSTSAQMTSCGFSTFNVDSSLTIMDPNSKRALNIHEMKINI